MQKKISSRYRKPLFALVMSCSTGLIVSAVILALRGVPGPVFLRVWMQAFLIAWPVVFVAILVIAPRVDKVLDVFVERHEAG